MIVELVNPFTRPNLRLALAVASAGLLSTSGCAKDPSKDAPLAQVGDSKPATSSDPLKQPARPPQTKDKEGIPLTGTIGFVGSKVTGSHEGIFKTWTGRVKLGKRIEDAAIRFEVDVASVYNNPDSRKPWSEKLDTHLRAEDFFHAAKFPKATFTSRSIKTGGEGEATHTVTGDLSLRGQTHSITFPANVTVDETSFAAKTEFTIKRSQWGIAYKGKPDDLIRDGVVLKIDIKGKR